MCGEERPRVKRALAPASRRLGAHFHAAPVRCSSVWELADKRVVIFHLVKWHRLAAGNVRDSSRTWWRQCFVSEEPFPHENPHGEYYNQKDK